MIDMLSRGEISLNQKKIIEEDEDEYANFGSFENTPVKRAPPSNQLLANRAKIAAKLKQQAMSANSEMSASSAFGNVTTQEAVTAAIDVQQDFFRRESTMSTTSDKSPKSEKSTKIEKPSKIEAPANPFGDEHEVEAEATNPFGDDEDDQESTNPFGPTSDDESTNPSANPFGEPDDDVPANPFGDDEDDEELDESNPFA